MVEYDAAGLDATYHAVSDPTRRHVLQRLMAGPARITDLAESRDISLAAVSKHIRVIEEAGLVKRTIAGREHWLALEAVTLKPASLWLDAYRRYWESSLDRLEHNLRKRR
jgi:DNA-binding transcriptional ArsR family regulator